MSGNVSAYCSPKGTVEKQMMLHVVCHFNKYIRDQICYEQPYLITLDSHSSRQEPYWLGVAEGLLIEVVLLSANITQLLQSDDGISTWRSNNIFVMSAICSTTTSWNRGISSGGNVLIVCSFSIASPVTKLD